MVLHKEYLKVGQSARNSLFGVGAIKTSPLRMLMSTPGRVCHARLATICFGLFALAIGIILSSVPWVDYMLLKNLKLMNGTICHHYWQKPGVDRLTKVYLFNVTNPDNFLKSGEKPILQEVGPWVYREDMEKVNIKFHDNGTVSYQHNKILKFVPELSVDKSQKLTIPNISLLSLASQTKDLNHLFKIMISMGVQKLGLQPFFHVTPEELLFGYDDKLTALAHTFYPKHRRPMKKMGLLLGRNGSGVTETHTIFNGETSMSDFGYLERLNGLDHLPYWPEQPCNAVRASEGSLFPARDRTHDDRVYIYDKDLCRVLPLDFRYMTVKNGVKAGFYSPPEDVFDVPEVKKSNKCFCPKGEVCAPRGLQNVSPCQYDAPVFLSFPHFYMADPALLHGFQGLQPVKELHEMYFKISPKLGVPVEAKIRVQLSLRIEKTHHISAIANFPDMIFPIVWLEEGVEELPPPIQWWVYVATTVMDVAEPLLSYGLIACGVVTLLVAFVRGYKNVAFTQEIVERGRETIRRGSESIRRGSESIRRGSSFLINGQHRLLIVRDSYTLLESMSGDPDPDCEEDDREFEVDL